MTTIELGTVLQEAAQNEFWALRAKAIQSYSNLEQSLFNLFVVLTGMQPAEAGIVFFKITNSQARNRIIEKLFQKKHGSNFNLFRNSLIDQLRPLDTRRNELVHWNTITEVNEQGFVALKLKPPMFWVTTGSPELDSHALVAFMNECSFYSRLLNMFHLVTANPRDLPPEVVQTWLRIFSQPIIYPPLAGHPLSLNPGAPDNPSQAFQM